MNPRHLELALKKQRLQLRAQDQRERFLDGLEGVERTERGFHRLYELTGWMRQHAPLVSLAAGLLLLARPRLALRVVRRGWLGWLAYRRLRGMFHTLIARL